MKKVIGIAIGGILILFLILGILRSRATEKVESIEEIQQKQGIPVFTVEAQKGEVRQVRKFYGTIRAAEQMTVSAKVSDRIDKLLVRVGDNVKQGQPLAQFDTTASMASVVQLRLAAENANRDVERMQVLFEQGAVSRQTLDQVLLGAEVARQNYSTARNSVILYAPMAGTVARLDRNEGDHIGPGDPLLTITAGNTREITFDVPSEDRLEIHAGQNVRVHVNGEEPVLGRITQVSDAAGSMSRMFTVYAELPYTKYLLPGMLATVEVTVKDRKDVMQVPFEAPLTREDGTVLVTIQDDAAHIIPVKLGVQGDSNVEILSGLQGGEVVAVFGHKGLDEGTKVRIVEEKK